MNSIYDIGNYDYKSNWYNWYINGYENASLVDTIQAEPFESFTWKQTQPFLTNTRSVREEMLRLAEKLKAENKRISIPISGMDSEAIARVFKELNANIDLWHIKFWFKDDSETEAVKKIAKELDCDYTVLDFSWKLHKHHIFKAAKQTGCVATIKNCLSYVYEQIPENNYIVVANENFRLLGNRPKKILKDNKGKPGDLPFEIRRLTGRFWGQKNRRYGCYCFYDSDIRLVSSIVNHEKFYFNPKTGERSDKDVIASEFPELVFKEKTEPFGNKNYRISKLVERHLNRTFAQPNHKLPDWRNIGNIIKFR